MANPPNPYARSQPPFSSPLAAAARSPPQLSRPPCQSSFVSAASSTLPSASSGRFCVEPQIESSATPASLQDLLSLSTHSPVLHAPHVVNSVRIVSAGSAGFLIFKRRKAKTSKKSSRGGGAMSQSSGAGSSDSKEGRTCEF